jgi:SynChlorMet cassette protein ScmC
MISEYRKTERDQDMAADHRAPYLLSLADGRTWEIAPCAGADDGVVSWVSSFASFMGLECKVVEGARGMRFGRVQADDGGIVSSYDRFFPPLPEVRPSESWRGWGRAGIVLIRHPGIRDVFCALHRDSSPIIEQMRRVLVPVIEETISMAGLPIHGALIERKGQGVFLLGRSGAGKTTCCRRLPACWHVLGDDLALAVRNADDGFSGHPLPTWSAVQAGAVRWPCRANRSVALKAIFQLGQSAEDSIERLSLAEAAAAIKEACAQALAPLRVISPGDGMGTSLQIRILKNAVALSAAVPAFRLQVSLGGRFWERIEDALEGCVEGHYRMESQSRAG